MCAPAHSPCQHSTAAHTQNERTACLPRSSTSHAHVSLLPKVSRPSCHLSLQSEDHIPSSCPSIQFNKYLISANCVPWPPSVLLQFSFNQNIALAITVLCILSSNQMYSCLIRKVSLNKKALLFQLSKPSIFLKAYLKSAFFIKPLCFLNIAVNNFLFP